MTARRKIHLAIAAAVALLLVGLMPVLEIQRHYEVDVNSGRTRESPSLLGFEFGWVEHDTDFSRLLAMSGTQPGPPDWHRYHTKARSLRINYTYGGIMSNVRGLMEYSEYLGVPAPDRVRLAMAARRCMQAHDRFSLDVNFENPMIEVHGEDGTVLASWRQAPTP